MQQILETTRRHNSQAVLSSGVELHDLTAVPEPTLRYDSLPEVVVAGRDTESSKKKVAVESSDLTGKQTDKQAELDKSLNSAVSQIPSTSAAIHSTTSSGIDFVRKDESQTLSPSNTAQPTRVVPRRTRRDSSLTIETKPETGSDAEGKSEVRVDFKSTVAADFAQSDEAKVFEEGEAEALIKSVAALQESLRANSIPEAPVLNQIQPPTSTDYNNEELLVAQSILDLPAVRSGGVFLVVGSDGESISLQKISKIVDWAGRIRQKPVLTISVVEQRTSLDIKGSDNYEASKLEKLSPQHRNLNWFATDHSDLAQLEERLVRVIADARNSFEFVFVVNAGRDSAVLEQLCRVTTGIVTMTELGATDRELMQLFVQDLRLAGGKILGTVVTEA